MMTIKLGIDLGTSNTLACIFSKTGGLICLELENNSVLLPSVVAVYTDGSILVGTRAKQFGIANPDRAIFSSKTFMGTDKKWVIDGREFTPQKVAEIILTYVKNKVLEEVPYPEEQICFNVLVTYPADFQADAKILTKKVAEKVFNNTVSLQTEPVSAAIKTLFSKNVSLQDGDHCLVVDIGGGTFDLSLCKYNKKQGRPEPEWTGGDKSLGGNNFDDYLVNDIIKFINREYELDLSTYQNSHLTYEEYIRAIYKIRLQATRVKEMLSTQNSFNLVIDYLTNDIKDFNYVVSREKFNNVSKPLLSRIENAIKIFCNDLVKYNICSPDNIKYVVLAGGTCYIPAVQEVIRSCFSNQTKILSQQNLMLIVAEGACIINQFFSLKDGSILIPMDVPHSFGVLSINDYGKPYFECLIKKGEKCPLERTKQFTTTGVAKSVPVYIYESNEEALSNPNADVLDLKNYYLIGTSMLDNLGNSPLIDVTFRYIQAGIPEVYLKEQNTGLEKKVEIDINHIEPVMQTEPVSPTSIVLLIDCSVSMISSMSNVIEACHMLFSGIIDLSVHEIGLIRFNDKAQILTPKFTNDFETLKKATFELKASGRTIYHKALEDAIKLCQIANNSNKVVIMLTDGVPLDDQNDIDRNLKILENQDIPFITIGIANEKGLRKEGLEYIKGISSIDKETGEKYFYSIDNIDELANVFKKVMNNLKLI